MAVLHIDIQTAIAATMFLKAFGGLLLIISISFVVFLLACGRNLVHALETTNRIGIVSCWCRRSRSDAPGTEKRRIIQQAIFSELCVIVDTGKPDDIDACIHGGYR